MADKKHFDEEVVEAVEEAFWADVKLMMEWMTVEGRPRFATPKTDEELWADFRNPDKLAATIASVERRQRVGLAAPGEVQRLLARVTKLDAQMVERGLNGPA